jgi:hypothetical protein
MVLLMVCRDPEREIENAGTLWGPAFVRINFQPIDPHLTSSTDDLDDPKTGSEALQYDQ